LPGWSQDENSSVNLTADDLLSLKSVADPQISPSGDWIAYTVESVDFDADESSTQIYMVSTDGSEVVQLTSGDYSASTPRWSPDSSTIAFTSNRSDEPDSNDNNDIWVVSAKGDAKTRTARQITRNPGSDYRPAWSNDGRTITYISVTEPDLIWYATNHLAIVPAAGGEERVLTAALDRNVSTPAFTADDESILFVLEDSAEQHLAQYDLTGDSVQRLVDGELSVREFSLHASGTVAIRLSAPRIPGEIFLWQDGVLHQVTHTNDTLLGERRLAGVRNVTFSSADGTEIEGFIFTPPVYDPGEKYPTILRIHGGPGSQYDFSFNRDAQLFAANGYVVVVANPRGSSGYGQDFSAALFAEWGVKDFEDVMAAVDYAIAEGYSDPERLGVGGWSYGGILTNYVITRTDRFEGAISGASEVNYAANYGHDHYQLQWELELGLPWENRDAWEKISPFNDVGKVTTPTLIMGGKEDWNVPIQNSEQLYQALRRRGITTQLVVYPDESHGISRPSFQKDRYERYLAWYDKHVRGE
jgi:dipeptidyl aminopeptidase/acylaminoacyl peptidase